MKTNQFNVQMGVKQIIQLMLNQTARIPDNQQQMLTMMVERVMVMLVKRKTAVKIAELITKPMKQEMVQNIL